MYLKVIIIILFVLNSCSFNKMKYKEFNFKMESFDWNPDPYKFSSYINDSILTKKGSEFSSWEFSYIGDINRVYELWDYQATQKGEIAQSLKDSFALYKRIDAIPYILEQAKSHQIVIINEAHHMPQHRVFVTQLLDGLYNQGFRHFGMETYLASPMNDSTLQVNGHATLKSGYYSKEPQFGNLIRSAHQIGYKLFGYESENHKNGKEREINHARNIEKYLLKYPNEKLIIYCGFDHGYEGQMGYNWEKAMAGRLKEFTNLDPLTINQVKFSERSKRVYEDPFYQFYDHPTSSVFITENNESFGNEESNAWFDIFVFHPRRGKNFRASWLKYGERREVEFSFENAPIDCPCLVFAFKKGEIITNAVPYDIQEVIFKKAILVLDDSEFNIVILNQSSKALKTELKGSK